MTARCIAAVWGKFSPNEKGVCVRCGRTISWHAGYGCYSPTASGMPKPVPVDQQLDLFTSPIKEKEASVS